MAKTEKKQAKGTAEPASKPAKFNEKLGFLILKRRKSILVFAIIILVVKFGLGIYMVFENKAKNNAAEQLEKLEASYLAIENNSELENKTMLASVIVEADKLIKAQKGRYPAIRAIVIKAEALYALGDIEGSEKAFADLAESYPRSHLAVVALFNAAVAAEERNELENALSYLLKAENKYFDSAAIDRIRLATGRIYEKQKSYEKAMEVYLRLTATGTESDWTKIARDRIIFIKTQGFLNK